MAKVASIIDMPDSFADLIFETQSHLGGPDITNKMRQYVFAQRRDGVSVFDIERTWEKFILAARAIAGISFPETICTVSCKAFGRKAVLKFSESIGCKPITSRFIPGSFTNTTVKGSMEPRLIIVSDPSFDKQAIKEASMVNCPVIAFCNTDASLVNIDIAIPVNNRSPKAIGASFFILSKLVNYIRNGQRLEENMKNVELFFFRDSLELEKLLKEHDTDSKVQFASPDMHNGEADYGRSAIEAETGSER